MQIGIPMILKGVQMIASHVGEMRKSPSKALTNAVAPSTLVGSGLATATYLGGSEIHALIGVAEGATTEQLAAHVAVYVVQAVLGVMSIWAMAKKPGTTIDD